MTQTPAPLFLGPAAENAETVERFIVEALRDHAFWRRNFHPEDGPFVHEVDRRTPAFEEKLATLRQELYRLLSRLKAGAPFFSPRYVGHMTSDVMIASLVGYFAAMLYNPNNISEEGAPVTMELELEVGRQLARLVGYGERAWGHLTSGGTVANLEALWAARALKYFAPLAAGVARVLDLPLEVAGEDLRTLRPWQLMNLPAAEVLALRQRLVVLAAEAPAVGRALGESELGTLGLMGFHQRFAALYGEPLPVPVVLAPATAHYSWNKIVDLLGLGRTQLVPLPVDAHYRVDADRYFALLAELAQRDVPVLATVAVLGATETGALDPLADLRAAAREPECRELAFHWHVDAAYGGYATAMFRDAQGGWTEGPDCVTAAARHFRALEGTDSITIDPHKLGYTHYPAGAVVYADNRMRELLATDAPYVFHDDAPHGQALGRYIVEGSKPGAAAAAVWLCHQVTPLDETGYGALIGPTCAAAQELHASLAAYRSPEGFRLIPLNTPDLNLVIFLAVPPDVRSLAQLNHFNEALFAHFTTAPDRLVFSHAYLFSKTDLEIDVYGAGLRARLEPDLCRLLEEGATLSVLRSTVMNPFVPKAIAEGPYLEDLLTALEIGMRACVSSLPLGERQPGAWAQPQAAGGEG